MKNWIEQAMGKEMAWSPIHIGYKSGRPIYLIVWRDGTEKEYYIDYENREIEETETEPF